MRIAIVGNFGLAGRQTMAVRALPLARELARRGHAVQMAMPVRCPEDLSRPPDTEGVSIAMAGAGLRLPLLVQACQLVKLLWFSLRWRPTVLYCFKPIVYSGALLWLFWWTRRLGLYRGLLALDTDDWEGDGGWNDRLPLPRWVKRLVGWQERWSLRHADVVTVASRELLMLADQAGGRNLVYVPNALAACPSPLPEREAVGSRSLLGLPGGPIVLLYTRFVEYSVERLLLLLDLVLRQRPDATLLVVGQGLEGEERRLHEAATARSLDRSIHLAGWVPPERLPAFFAASDVAIYPMDDNLLNRSKCPMKLLDLLAAGVPVVADRVGQAEEYIDHGRTGLLVEPGKPEAMADAVLSLLHDPGMRRTLADAAAADAVRRWSWERWGAVVEKALGQA